MGEMNDAQLHAELHRSQGRAEKAEVRLAESERLRECENRQTAEQVTRVRKVKKVCDGLHDVAQARVAELKRLKKEVYAAVHEIPDHVIVREDGAEEDVAKSLAVSAVKVRVRVAELEELAERRRRERADALNVKTTDGMTVSEWVLRTGVAERERDEARARVVEVEQLYGEACWRLQDLGETEVPLGSSTAGRVCEVHNEPCVTVWRCEEPANMNGAPRLVCPSCLEERSERAELALRKINDVRNSIVGTQHVNWSEHVYPLVAALDEAGVEGQAYPEALENFRTLIEQRDEAVRVANDLRSRIDAGVAKWKRVRVERNGARAEVKRLTARLVAAIAELMTVVRPFMLISGTDVVEVTVGDVTFTRADVRRLVRFVSDPGAAIDRMLDVVRKAEAWVNGWDPEADKSFDLAVLRPYCEKMRRLAMDLKGSVEARRGGTAEPAGEVE